METNKIHAGDNAADLSNRRHSSNPSSGATTLAWLAASLFILFGVTFELGTLGWGPHSNLIFWLIWVIGRNVWIVLVDLAPPEINVFAKIWPLVIAGLGAAMLLITEQWSQLNSTLLTGSGRRKDHAN
jgi:hypothetical protein